MQGKGEEAVALRASVLHTASIFGAGGAGSDYESDDEQFEIDGAAQTLKMRSGSVASVAGGGGGGRKGRSDSTASLTSAGWLG